MGDRTNTRRRWFRFRLRTLLIVIALVAVPIAWVARERRQSKYEQQLAGNLRKHGFANIELGGPYNIWEYNDPQQPQVWWRNLAGRVLGERVLDIFGSESDLDELASIVRFPKLQSFGLHETKVSDLTPLGSVPSLRMLWLNHAIVSDLSPLERLTNLEELVLIDTPVSDLRPLAALKKLRHLAVADAPLVRDVTALAGLTNLEFLQLDGTNCDIAPLAGLTKLQTLTLDRTPTSDLTPLAGLANLEDVTLNDTQVSDLTPLAGLKKLINVDVHGTRVTKEQVDALKRALPNCTILHDPFPGD